MNGPSPHPAPEVLADLAEGRLTPAEGARVRAHLAACDRCATEVARLERLIGLMRADDSEEPPSWVVARATRLFRQRAADAPPSAWRRVLAELRFDSARMPLAQGLRSAQPGARQLLYGAAGYDLDLRLAPAGERWTVSGQVLGADEGGSIELRDAAGAVLARGAFGDLGEFALPPVAPGRYLLRLRAGDVEVEASDLVLGD